MKTLLAAGTLTSIVIALCGSAPMAFAQAGAHTANLGDDEVRRYETEATVFERRAARYAMAAKQYRAAGKPITTIEARRYDDLSDLYRQRAASDRALARRAR